MLEKHFKVSDSEWGGFGMIPKSGLEPRKKELDAKHVYRDIIENVSPPSYPKGCVCEKIVKGVAFPSDCPLFRGRKCVPENPVGPCMVSVEGACNVWYRNRED